MTEPLTGIVLAVQANFYRVQLDSDRVPTRDLLCTCRSRLKKIGQQICVGDRVVVEEPDWQGQRGAIRQILTRRNALDRPAVANVDRLLLVFSLTEPDIEPYQLSRFLVKAESSHLEVLLCLNKRDLVSASVWETWRDHLQAWGYPAIAISTYTREGVDELKQQLTSGVTVVSGPSGVGKSSLIGLLIPNLQLRVAEVSQRLGHGRHTTRHVELFALAAGGYLADTPGFMQPALDIAPTELAYYFPEAKQKLHEDTCQFHDCLHRDEPNCIVRGDWERYEHYRLFLEEVLAQQAKRKEMGTPDVSLKSKRTSGGQVQQEPRLLMKRHRRISRRAAHQELDSTYDAEYTD